jgi:hypothetical protein
MIRVRTRIPDKAAAGFDDPDVPAAELRHDPDWSMIGEAWQLVVQVDCRHDVFSC